MSRETEYPDEKMVVDYLDTWLRGKGLIDPDKEHDEIDYLNCFFENKPINPLLKVLPSFEERQDRIVRRAKIFSDSFNRDLVQLKKDPFHSRYHHTTLIGLAMTAERQRERYTELLELALVFGEEKASIIELEEEILYWGEISEIVGMSYVLEL